MGKKSPRSLRKVADRPIVAAPIAARGLILSFIVQFALAAAAFRVMGAYRLMDADEGHFLSAIRSTYNGLAPCRDFFFQQTPLLPYAYAAAMRLFGFGYETCLWVSVLCGAGLAVVTAAWFARGGGGVSASWVGWLLIVLNAQILFWMPTVKNHAMPLFFGALALYAASRRCESKRAAFWWGALAGFAAMGSVGTRLPALPFAVFAGLWVLVRAIPPSRPAGAWRGVLGFAAGVVPPALLVLRSVFPEPDVFYFDIIGFHEIRSGRLGAFGTMQTMQAELSQILRQHQFPGLLAIAAGVSIWSLAARARRAGSAERSEVRGRGRSAAAAAVAPSLVVCWLTLGGLGAVALALLPMLTFHQYFMVPLMFILLAGAPLWRALLAGRPRVLRALVVFLLLSVYALTPCNRSTDPNILIPSIELFNHRESVAQRPDGPPMQDSFPATWGYADVRAMSRALADVTGPEDLVMSTWQGYTFVAGRRDLPGNENFNARTVAWRLSEAGAHRLHIATNAELAAAIDRGEPKAVIFGFFGWPLYRDALFVIEPGTGKPTFRPELLRRYRLVKQIGGHQLFLRK